MSEKAVRLVGIVFVFVLVMSIALSGCHNTEYQEENSIGNTNTHIHTGIVFPFRSVSTEYNGYTYELGGEEDEDGYIEKSILYRYKTDGSKEEWYDLEGSNISGIFIDGELFYIQNNVDFDGTDYLKKLNLETLTVERVFIDYNIDGMFKYDDNILLPCRTKVVSYSLLNGDKKTIVNSEDLDGYNRMYKDYVFACNDKLWIIMRHTNRSDSKVYNVNLDGSDLSYAGFSIPSFDRIYYVDETNSELGYFADHNKKSISLTTGEIFDLES